MNDQNPSVSESAGLDELTAQIKARLIETRSWDLSKIDTRLDAADNEFLEWMENYDKDRVQAELDELMSSAGSTTVEGDFDTAESETATFKSASATKRVRPANGDA